MRKSEKIIGGTFGLLLLSLTAKVKAGWWSVGGVACTLLAIGVTMATSGAGSGWPGFALMGVEVSCIVYDIYDSEVFVIGSNPGDELLVDEVHAVAFAPLEIPDNEFAGVAVATNELISTLNAALQVIRNGGDNELQAASLFQLADCVEDIRYELQLIGWTDFELTGSQLAGIQADIAVSGVPEWEVSWLVDAGCSPAVLDRFVEIHLEEDFSAIESLSIGEALSQTRDGFLDRATVFLLGGI